MSDRIDLFPVVVIEDRYIGTYSGGAWIAVANATRSGRLDSVLDGAFGDDCAASDWGCDKPEWCAVGSTPDEAVQALYAKIKEPK